MMMSATLRTSARGVSSALFDPPPAPCRLRTTSVMPSAYGCAACTRACAFTIREAAISSMARVIFFVDSTDLIRRRRMRS